MVDGIMHQQYFDHRNDEAVKCEKYTMRYDIDDPEEIEVDYWNPVFVEGEKTSSVPAKITAIHKKSFWNPIPFVVFSFLVGNAVFEKYVDLPANYQIKYPDLHVGQLYFAECWDENVHRVVLHLDKQIKENLNEK